MPPGRGGRCGALSYAYNARSCGGDSWGMRARCVGAKQNLVERAEGMGRAALLLQGQDKDVIEARRRCCWGTSSGVEARWRCCGGASGSKPGSEPRACERAEGVSEAGAALRGFPVERAKGMGKAALS